MKNIRPYVAEFAGTFLLALVVRLAVTGNSPYTMFLAGAALGLSVYAIGGVSGAHCNPAITVAIWSIRKIRSLDAVFYILAQLLGAALALHVGAALTPTMTLEVVAANTWLVAACEALGAAILAWAVASAVHGKVHAAASGLTVGTGLTLGISVASVGSNGVLNPAVAFAIGSVSPMYLLAPFAGAVISMWGYKLLVK